RVPSPPPSRAARRATTVFPAGARAGGLRPGDGREAGLRARRGPAMRSPAPGSPSGHCELSLAPYRLLLCRSVNAAGRDWLPDNRAFRLLRFDGKAGKNAAMTLSLNI